MSSSKHAEMMLEKQRRPEDTESPRVTVGKKHTQQAIPDPIVQRLAPGDDFISIEFPKIPKDGINKKRAKDKSSKRPEETKGFMKDSFEYKIMEKYAEQYRDYSRQLKEEKITKRLEELNDSKMKLKAEPIEEKISQARERREKSKVALRSVFDRKRQPVKYIRQKKIASFRDRFQDPFSNSSQHLPGPGEYHQSAAWITGTHNVKFYNPV